MPHSCGNPLHDLPQWALFALPFLAPAYLWLRVRFPKVFNRGH